MIVGLSLMAVSALIMSGLLAHRHLELRRGASAASVSVVREKADPFIENVYAKTNRALSYLTPHHISIFFHNIFVCTGRFFMHLFRLGHNASAKLVEKAAQRKESLSKGGSPSFYMKQVNGVKKNSQSGTDATDGDTVEK